MYRFILSMAVLAILNCNAGTYEEESKVDTVEECIAKTNGSSYNMRRCTGKSITNTEKEIDFMYNKFIKSIEAEKIETLKRMYYSKQELAMAMSKKEEFVKVHTLWLEYRKSKCGLEEILYLHMGSMGRELTASCFDDMSKERLKDLQSTYQLSFEM